MKRLKAIVRFIVRYWESIWLIILCIIVIVLIAGYLWVCVPHWMDTLLNAPVMCIPRGR